MLGRKFLNYYSDSSSISLQAVFYNRFKESHPQLRLKLRAFEKLKPYFVKPCNERNVCCCRYHVEIDMLREGLNRIRDARKGFHFLQDCLCECEVCGSEQRHEVNCGAHTKVYTGTTSLSQEIVCSKSEDVQWNALSCVMDDCDNCDISKLAICPLESAASTTVTWKCFENEVIGHTPEGKPRKRIVEAYKETSAIVFFEYLKSKLPQFVRHNFIARWQDDHCKLSMKCLGEDMILSHIDYAENYTFEIQDQIQSMYGVQLR